MTDFDQYFDQNMTLPPPEASLQMVKELDELSRQEWLNHKLGKKPLKNPGFWRKCKDILLPNLQVVLMHDEVSSPLIKEVRQQISSLVNEGD